MRRRDECWKNGQNRNSKKCNVIVDIDIILIKIMIIKLAFAFLFAFALAVVLVLVLEFRHRRSDTGNDFRTSSFGHWYYDIDNDINTQYEQ